MTNSLLADSEVQKKDLNNPLWDFACEIYGIQHIRNLCLELQNQALANVNCLLSSAWAAKHKLVIDWEVTLSQITSWHTEVVVPLRAVRSNLGKNHAIEAYIRKSILNIELETEKVEIAILYQVLETQRLNNATRSHIFQQFNLRHLILQNLTNYFSFTGNQLQEHSPLVQQLVHTICDNWG